MQSATLSGKTNIPLGAKISSEGNYTKIDIASGPNYLRRRIERGQELSSAHFLTENLSQLGKRHSSVPVPDALQGTARWELCIPSAPVVNRLCGCLCERKTFVRYGTSNASSFGWRASIFLLAAGEKIPAIWRARTSGKAAFRESVYRDLSPFAVRTIVHLLGPERCIDR